MPQKTHWCFKGQKRRFPWASSGPPQRRFWRKTVKFENITASTKEKRLAKYSQEGGVGWGCFSHNVGAVLLKLYIESVQSVMSQCISLSSVWHLSSLLPSMGRSPPCGCQPSWWFYCSPPFLSAATSCRLNALRFLPHVISLHPHPPSPSLLESDRRAFLSGKRCGVFPTANLLSPSVWKEARPPALPLCK